MKMGGVPKKGIQESIAADALENIDGGEIKENNQPMISRM
jgi:hypothetical protein